MSEKLSPELIAEASLRANIIRLESGHFLAAGQNQFRTLWTRDFCHASRGLFVLGEQQVVRDHLTRLLQAVRADGLVPRVLDNRLVQWRVAYQTVRRALPALPEMRLREPLKAQYTDEHGSHAIDSNLLVILTALELRKYEGGDAWWLEHETALKKVWHWYDDKFRGDFIFQSAFADWQDSVRREGATFLTNFFYLIAGLRLQKLGWEIGRDLTQLSTRLRATFFDESQGVFRTLAEGDAVSLEGNLLAIEAEEFLQENEKQALWQSLLKHPLATLDGGHLGRCAYPAWPSQVIAWHVRLAKLDRYHSGLAWSWLVGLALKVAHLRNDRDMVERMRTKIYAMLLRDGEVVELYDPEDLWQPWGSWLIDSERPFSWGAGYLLEALRATQH